MAGKSDGANYWNGPPEPKRTRSRVDMYMPRSSLKTLRRPIEPTPKVADEGQAKHATMQTPSRRLRALHAERRVKRTAGPRQR